MAPTPDEMQRRLEELGRNIEAARKQAVHDGLLEEEPDERRPSFADPDPQHHNNG